MRLGPAAWPFDTRLDDSPPPSFPYLPLFPPISALGWWCPFNWPPPSSAQGLGGPSSVGGLGLGCPCVPGFSFGGAPFPGGAQLTLLAAPPSLALHGTPQTYLPSALFLLSLDIWSTSLFFMFTSLSSPFFFSPLFSFVPPLPLPYRTICLN